MATTIGKGVNITGSLTADEPVSIIGTLRGDVLVANHAVTVETGGRVDGAVTAPRDHGSGRFGRPPASRATWCACSRARR
jgi:cytoskeletal protein CcmA (bactofilin family)